MSARKSDAEIKDLVDMLDVKAQALLLKDGKHAPLVFFVNAGGGMDIILAVGLMTGGPGKDVLAHLIRRKVAAGCQAVVFIAESWATTTPKERRGEIEHWLATHGHSIREHPERKEVLMVRAAWRGHSISRFHLMHRDTAGTLVKVGPVIAPDIPEVTPMTEDRFFGDLPWRQP